MTVLPIASMPTCGPAEQQRYIALQPMEHPYPEATRLVIVLPLCFPATKCILLCPARLWRYVSLIAAT